MATILIDQDDTIARFNEGFSKIWKETYPDRIYIPPDQFIEFHVKENYPPEYADDIRKIYCAQGFILNLEIEPGAKEALEEMLSMGHDVRICTSPLSAYQNCVPEKYGWTEQHLGSEWTKRIILTKDKTLIRGDILIDDKDEITGKMTPTWKHILYARPHNEHIEDRPRITWDDWKEILGHYLK